jgi:hypothetical protein
MSEKQSFYKTRISSMAYFIHSYIKLMSSKSAKLVSHCIMVIKTAQQWFILSVDLMGHN